MTLGQKRGISKFKPLPLCITAILLSVMSPLTQAQTSNSTNGMVSPTPSSNSITSPAPSSNSIATPTPSSNGITSPTPSTNTLTSPTTSTSTTVTTTPTPSNSAVVTTTAPKPVAVNPNAPMDQANMSDNDLLNWATKAAQIAYTYDFKNYPNQLQGMQDYFTPEGWKAFSAALNQSNNLNVVQNRKLVASASITGKATLVKEGVKNGAYNWKVQLPMTATYESESRLIKQNLMVTMLISRSKNNPKGVGVTHFVAVIVPANQPPVSTPSTINPQPATPTSTGTSTNGTNTVSIYNQTPPGIGAPSSNPRSSNPLTNTTTTPNPTPPPLSNTNTNTNSNNTGTNSLTNTPSNPGSATTPTTPATPMTPGT